MSVSRELRQSGFCFSTLTPYDKDLGYAPCAMPACRKHGAMREVGSN
jgi:hypothetical protein